MESRSGRPAKDQGAVVTGSRRGAGFAVQSVIRPVGGCPRHARAPNGGSRWASRRESASGGGRRRRGAAQAKARESGSSSWWLTPLRSTACCARCATVIREGGDAVYRHEPREVRVYRVPSAILTEALPAVAGLGATAANAAYASLRRRGRARRHGVRPVVPSTYTRAAAFTLQNGVFVNRRPKSTGSGSCLVSPVFSAPPP